MQYALPSACTPQIPKLLLASSDTLRAATGTRTGSGLSSQQRTVPSSCDVHVGGPTVTPMAFAGGPVGIPISAGSFSLASHETTAVPSSAPSSFGVADVYSMVPEIVASTFVMCGGCANT